MSKNAYEIRQELLYLAHQLVKEKNEMEFRNHLENNRVKQIRGEEPNEVPMNIISESQIFDLAEKLNDFVSKKK